MRPDIYGKNLPDFSVFREKARKSGDGEQSLGTPQSKVRGVKTQAKKRLMEVVANGKETIEQSTPAPRKASPPMKKDTGDDETAEGTIDVEQWKKDRVEKLLVRDRKLFPESMQRDDALIAYITETHKAAMSKIQNPTFFDGAKIDPKTIKL